MKRQIQRRPAVKRKPAAKQKRRLTFRALALAVACAAIIAGGLFTVAVQHFASMDLGMQNSKLRKQVEDLEAEKRRLQLAKEVTLSPAEIKRTALRLGFGSVEAAAVVAAVKQETPPSETRVAAAMPASPAEAQPTAIKAVAKKPAGEITRTVSAEPARKRVTEQAADAAPVKKQADAQIAEGRPRRVADNKPSPASAVAKLR
jgi:hypothetical protein